VKIRGLVAVLASCAVACGALEGANSAAPRDGGSDASLPDAVSTDGKTEFAREAGSANDGFALPELPDAVSIDTACAVPTPVCPLSAPDQGAPCALPADFVCEYGDDPNDGCDTLADCMGDAGWRTFPPASQGCPTSPSPPCPPTFAAALDGGITCPALEISQTGMECFYPEGTCNCGISSLPPDASLVLTCSPPPLSPCPATRPRLGTSCSEDEVSCTSYYYGTCYVEQGEHCSCGTWQLLPLCPYPLR
jgi:hypothetical protein